MCFLTKSWSSLSWALILSAMITAVADADEPKHEKRTCGFEVELQTIHSGYDRKTCWVHPRAGMIPGDCRHAGDPFTVVLTMHELRISDSDCYLPIHDMRTDDGGKTWTGPTSQADAFGRRPMPDRIEEGISDFWPTWHAKTGKLLGTGHTIRYRDGTLPPLPRPRDTTYSVYDPQTRRWSSFRKLETPDDDLFFMDGAGSTQRVDLEGRHIEERFPAARGRKPLRNVRMRYLRALFWPNRRFTPTSRLGHIPGTRPQSWLGWTRSSLLVSTTDRTPHGTTGSIRSSAAQSPSCWLDGSGGSTVLRKQHAHHGSTDSCRYSQNDFMALSCQDDVVGSRCECAIGSSTKRLLTSPSQLKSPDEQQGIDCTEGFTGGVLSRPSTSGPLMPARDAPGQGLKSVSCGINKPIMAGPFRVVIPKKHAHHGSTFSCHFSPSQLHGAVFPRRSSGFLAKKDALGFFVPFSPTTMVSTAHTLMDVKESLLRYDWTIYRDGASPRTASSRMARRSVR